MSNLDYEEYSFSNDYFSLDTTNFPHVYIKFNNKQPTDKEFEEYINSLNKFFLQEKPYVMLTDMSDTGYLKGKYRIKLSETIEKNRERISALCKGVAYLTGSSAHKFLLQALFSVQNQPYEYTVVSKKEKATEWLEGQSKK